MGVDVQTWWRWCLRARHLHRGRVLGPGLARQRLEVARVLPQLLAPQRSQVVDRRGHLVLPFRSDRSDALALSRRSTSRW
jgi:hypothetical protein